MTPKHQLTNIRRDLLDLSDHLSKAERVPFFEGQIAVCIWEEYVKTIIKMLKADAKALAGIVEGM